MVPVLNHDGVPTAFPASWMNKYGYDLEFDEHGRTDRLQIDFTAVTAHLIALDQAASARGMAIDLVVFAPEYRKHLIDSTGIRLDQRLPFLEGASWIRHDEHYHVDFRLPPT
jgi:penicillin-insensitive murein endopeptidase